MRKYLKLLFAFQILLLLIPSISLAEEKTHSSYNKKDESVKQIIPICEKAIKKFDKRMLDVIEFNSNLAAKLDETEEVEQYDRKLLSQYESIIIDPDASKIEKLNALKKISQIKYRQNNYKDVIQLCQQLLIKYPNESPILEIEAEFRHCCAGEFLAAGNIDQSIQEYEIILSMDLIACWHILAKSQIAHFYLLKGEDENALLWYRRIINEHQDLVEGPAYAHLSIAEYYYSKSELEKANDELNILLERYPNSAWANVARQRYITPRGTQ